MCLGVGLFASIIIGTPCGKLKALFSHKKEEVWEGSNLGLQAASQSHQRLGFFGLSVSLPEL